MPKSLPILLAQGWDAAFLRCARFHPCSWHRTPEAPGISEVLRALTVSFVMLTKRLLEST